MIKMLLSLMLLGCVTVQQPQETAVTRPGLPGLTKSQVQFLRDKVVYISNILGHAGTGVILRSKINGSLVLTNAHVCDAVGPMGQVERNNVFYNIVAIKRSTTIDACLLFVNTNLGVNTPISNSGFEFGDQIILSGYPIPGYFKPSFGNALFKIAVDRGDYETSCTTTNVLVNYGSSGSGVFNKNGELISLVFLKDIRSRSKEDGCILNSGELKTFMQDEIPRLKWKRLLLP